jgi:hypothetical protein
MGPGPIYSPGFALLSFEEEPCPLSLSHGFFTIQPSPNKGIRLFPKLFLITEMEMITYQRH